VAEAGPYVVAQLAGGLAGALSYAGITSKTFPLGSPAQAGLLEVIFTFVLCFAVLCVATRREPSKDMFGLVIGSCVTIGGFAAGSVGGGVLNPAAAFGIETADAIVSKGQWLPCLGYSLAEVAGGAAAAGVFMVTNPAEYGK